MIKREVVHPVLGTIIYAKNPNSKSVRVSVRTGRGLLVSLPTYCTYSSAEAFVEQNCGRIAEMLKKVEQRINARKSVQPADDSVPKEVILKDTAKRARATLPKILAELSEKMNRSIRITDKRGNVVYAPFNYNRLSLKNNVSNWGSCSVKRNINLNINLINLPEHLIRYVILHELCHLVYMNHGAQFHALLDSVCGGREKELSTQLRAYTLRD